jgi:hypothetical protein
VFASLFVACAWCHFEFCSYTLRSVSWGCGVACLLLTWRMFAESVLEALVADISVVGFGIRVFVCLVVVFVCVGCGLGCVFGVGWVLCLS